MHVPLKEVLVTVPVIASFALFSCSDNPAGNGSITIKQTLSSEESADLDKMAQTITTVISVNTLDEEMGGLEKKQTEIMTDVCSTVSTGVEACSYTDENSSTYIDTTWNFSDANRTVPAEATDIPAGQYLYSKDHTLMHDATTSSDLFSESAEKTVDFESLLTQIGEQGDFSVFFTAMDITMKCWGTINYYNDNLLLDFYDVRYTIKNGKIAGDYNFKIMDGKYTVKMKFNVNLTDLMSDPVEETDTVAEVMRGPIFNASNEQVGVFVVYNDDSVEIFDNDGTSRKQAG